MDSQLQSKSEPAALSMAAVSSRLGLGLSNIKNRVASGEIRSFKVGRRVLIPFEEIDAFISRRMAESGR